MLAHGGDPAFSFTGVISPESETKILSILKKCFPKV
jgi:hypothetical protein